MRNVTHESIQSGHSFPISGHFFQFFKKGQGITLRHTHAACALVSLMDMKQLDMFYGIRTRYRFLPYSMYFLFVS